MSEKTTAAIPQRDSINEPYKWNLSDIYISDETWEDDFKKAQEIINKAADYNGKLDDPKTLFEVLELRTNLSLTVFNLFQYAHLNLDLDNRVSKYQEMNDRAMMLSTQSSTAFSFIEPELMKLSNDRLVELSQQFEKKDLYDFYIKELIRSRKHIRSEEVEEVLSLTSMFSKGPSNSFSMLDYADLKYPEIKDENGNMVQLTKQRFSKFMDSSDPRVRKDASDQFYSVYKDHVNSIGAMLSTEVNKNIFYVKSRRYDSALHAALDGDNIPTDVYMSLLETTEKQLSGLHRWTELRKKILKLDEIAPYDMLCPLFPDSDYDVPYDDAVKNVMHACKPLGEQYNDVLKFAFGARWVDVYETEGKAGGAYSWGNYSSHPFVLMNYNDTVDNMFTLAHELGHCLHSYLSNKTLPYQKSQYSIFVAEVASTLNEGLLQQCLLKKAQTKEEKLYLLNRHIDNTMGTYFHQVMYARFELTIHQMVEQGQALSPDSMSKLWGDLTKQYYGDALTLDEMSPLKWSRIPHFYNNFYVFQYATSYAASQAILQKFLEGDKDIIEKYLTLLKSGGKDYPINLLKECGVDMSTPAPFEATIKLFEDQVNEVAKLTE